MNKQELIEKLKSNKKNEECNLKQGWGGLYTKGKAVSYHDALELAEQLDEPQKRIMPKFFDDWAKQVIERRDKFYAISLITRAGWGYGVDYEINENESPYATRELADWLVESPLYLNKEKAVNALLYGYEVKNEPLYRVKLGEGYFVEYQGRGALIILDNNKEVKIFDSKSDAERTAQTIGGTVEEVVEG